MLSILVITFLPRSKCLLISWLQSPSAVILEPPKIKSVTVSTVSASICHGVMGPDAITLVFWMLSFKPTFFFFWSHHFMSNGVTMESVRYCFFGLQTHCRWWLQPWNEKRLAPWKKSYDQPRQNIKKSRDYFANKYPSNQTYGFSHWHVWM